MPRKILLYVMLIACFGTLWSKSGANGITLRVKIVNSLTNREVLFPKVAFYRMMDSGADSIKVDAAWSVGMSGFLGDIKVPRQNGLYMIVFEGINHKAASMFGAEMERKVKGQGSLGRTEQYFEITDDTPGELELPEMRVTRSSMNRTLGEVSVTASKVMFYHRGDTLVYNADAFLLAEGSMLDALLRQMPGVELKNDGQIFLKGKKVHNLLLNGKDLFNGQRQLMLENLAAYTVKEVQFYNKAGRASELMERDMRDSKYVMDVKLKREYATGWSLNTNAGYGTRNRYFGKLFGMWFTENASLTAHFNANNLNDETTPGSNNESMEVTSSNGGEKSKIEGGLNYLVSGQNELWELKGSVKGNRLKSNVCEDVTAQNYLDGGDTFSYSWKRQCSKDRAFETLHTFFMKFGKAANLTVRPAFSYKQSDVTSSNVGLLLNSYVDTLSFNGALNICDDESIREKVVNRNIRNFISSGDNMAGNVEVVSDIRLFRSRHMLKVAAWGLMKKQVPDRFERYLIDYGQNQETGTYQDRYFREHPNRDREGKASVNFNSSIGSSVRYNLKYEISHKSSVRTSYLYNLETFADNLKFGVLPSEAEYQQYIDIGQSYDTHYQERRQSFMPALSVDRNIAGRVFRMWLDAEFNFYHRSFRYARPENCSLAKSVDNFLPKFSLSVSSHLSKNVNLSAGVNSEPQLQNMLHMMDVTDTTDPLMVKIGNSGLKTGRTNGVYCVLSTNADKKYFNNEASILYIRRDNAFARGYMYDPENGVRYTSVYNVNGNQSLEGEHKMSTYLDKRHRVLFDLKTRARYGRSVDMAGTIGVVGVTVPPLRKVDTGTWHEELKVDWSTGTHRLSAKIQSSLNRYFSKDPGFLDFTSWTSSYGASGVFNLPMNWGLSTDLTFYMRRGYLDNRLNTTDLVWNIRLSKSVMKGSLVFFVDGYDLLHQLSNVTHEINAQARTVTVTNVIPSYFMFHVQFRINREPKH